MHWLAYLMYDQHNLDHNWLFSLQLKTFHDTFIIQSKFKLRGTTNIIYFLMTINLILLPKISLILGMLINNCVI